MNIFTKLYNIKDHFLKSYTSFDMIIPYPVSDLDNEYIMIILDKTEIKLCSVREFNKLSINELILHISNKLDDKKELECISVQQEINNIINKIEVELKSTKSTVCKDNSIQYINNLFKDKFKISVKFNTFHNGIVLLHDILNNKKYIIDTIDSLANFGLNQTILIYLNIIKTVTDNKEPIDIPKQLNAFNISITDTLNKLMKSFQRPEMFNREEIFDEFIDCMKCFTIKGGYKNGR